MTTPGRPGSLSARERHVLRLIEDGLRREDPELADEFEGDTSRVSELGTSSWVALTCAGVAVMMFGLVANFVIVAAVGFGGLVFVLDRWSRVDGWTALRTAIGLEQREEQKNGGEGEDR